VYAHSLTLGLFCLIVKLERLDLVTQEFTSSLALLSGLKKVSDLCMLRQVIFRLKGLFSHEYLLYNGDIDGIVQHCPD